MINILSFGKMKSKRAGGAEAENKRQVASVRQWLPLTGIMGHTAKARDGRHLAFLRVQPVNLSLKSENEKKRIVSAFSQTLDGLKEPIQLFSISRPIDLDGYIRQISEKITAETNPVKKRLLKEYLRYTSGLVAEGEAHERRFFVILSRADASSALNAASELASDLLAAGLCTELCDSQEILSVLFCFLNPDKAALEKIDPPGKALPAIFS